MDLDGDLQLGKSDKMLDDSCEVCSMAKKVNPSEKSNQTSPACLYGFLGPKQRDNG